MNSHILHHQSVNSRRTREFTHKPAFMPQWRVAVMIFSLSREFRESRESRRHVFRTRRHAVRTRIFTETSVQLLVAFRGDCVNYCPEKLLPAPSPSKGGQAWPRSVPRLVRSKSLVEPTNLAASPFKAKQPTHPAAGRVCRWHISPPRSGLPGQQLCLASHIDYNKSHQNRCSRSYLAPVRNRGRPPTNLQEAAYP